MFFFLSFIVIICEVSLCRPVWPQTHRNPPAYIPWQLGLKLSPLRLAWKFWSNILSHVPEVWPWKKKKKTYSSVDPAQQLRVCGVHTRNGTAPQVVQCLHPEHRLAGRADFTHWTHLSACRAPSFPCRSFQRVPLFMLITSSLGQRMNKQEVRANITPRRGRVPGRAETVAQPRIAVHVYKRQSKMGSHQEVLGYETHQSWSWDEGGKEY